MNQESPKDVFLLLLDVHREVELSRLRLIYERVAPSFADLAAQRRDEVGAACDGLRTRYEAAVARTADDAAEGARLLAWLREIGRVADDLKDEPACGSIGTANALALIRLAVAPALRGDVCPPPYDDAATTQRETSRRDE